MLGYRIVRNGVVTTTLGVVTTTQVTGLTPSTQYTFNVRAFNSVGDSPNSPPVTPTTGANVPSAPTGLTAGTPTSTSVPLSWTASTSTASAPVQGYRVYRTGSTTVLATVAYPATTVSVPNLTANTAYTFYVRAYNTGGESASSNQVQVTTSAGTGTSPPPPSGGFIIYAAGDMAISNSDVDTKTSDALLAATDKNAVLVLGDCAYDDGTPTEFANNYNPTWGRLRLPSGTSFKGTFPCPGNHDYGTADASGYFNYFGPSRTSYNSTSAAKYYSWDEGVWHLVSLDANRVNAAQNTWLANDLDDAIARGQKGILAFWHQPRWSSSGIHASAVETQPFIDILYGRKADIILNGHNHHYERLAKVNASGARANDGMRIFIVGTGGKVFYRFTDQEDAQSQAAGIVPKPPHPSSDFRDNTTWGSLRLQLTSTGYSWRFVRAGDFTGAYPNADPVGVDAGPYTNGNNADSGGPFGFNVKPT